MARPLRLLSIDGGGIRGYLPSLLLAEIERRAGIPAANLFDLAAGTSTGGIIAIGLASGLHAAELAEFYPRYGRRIFGGSEQTELSRRILGTGATWRERLLGPPNVVGPVFGRPVRLGGAARHDAKGLSDVFQEVFGERRLSSSVLPLAITSYDARQEVPVVLSSVDALVDSTYDLPLRTVARATSAAPTYFPPMEVEWAQLQRRFVDGGVWANNPSMVALTEAMRLAPHLDADRAGVHLVSLGTGVKQPVGNFAAGEPWLKSAGSLIGLATSVEGPDLLAFRALGDSYARFDVTDDTLAGAMDDPSEARLAGLRAAAQTLIAERSAELDSVVEVLLS